MELVYRFWGEVSFRKTKMICQNHDLNLERKKYYNFLQRKITKNFIFKNNFAFFFICVDQKDFCVQFCKIYILNN